MTLRAAAESAPAWMAIVGPILTLVGVVAAAWIGAWAGRQAALKNAKANDRNSEAAIQDAFTRAYDAASNNWARYTEGMQRWLETQSKELAKLADRQAATDMALEAAKIRADRSEHLYSIAIIYLRRIASWVNEHWPGEELPPPPPELQADL